MSFLHKNIISPQPEIFGIDLSDLSVKVFQLEEEGKEQKIISFGTLDIPAGAIDDGKIIDKNKVADIIMEAVKKAKPKKITAKKAICSIPESKAFLRMISIPKMSKEEAEEAIKWEMEANIPIPIDQAYYDWQFIGECKKNKYECEDNKQNVLTVAVSKEIIDDLIEVLDKAGIDTYGLEIESIASARSLISEKNENPDSITLIVDIGERKTSFIVIVNKVPNFNSSITFSSAGIDDAIAKSLNLSPKEAEEAKKNQGIENFNKDNPIFNATKPLIENLIQDLVKTMNFYEEVAAKNSKIEKIILCGGGANLKGLAAYMAKKLNKNVEIGDPWTNINLKGGANAINKENSIRYATAIGLALRAINYYD